MNSMVLPVKSPYGAKEGVGILPIKIAAIYGTRPEAIKLAPIARLLAHHPQVAYQGINTGQHDNLMPTIMEKFGLPPPLNLGLLAPGQTLLELQVRLLQELPLVLHQASPHAVIVQGDTATAFVASWAAFHDSIPLAHVEAGLRTYRPHAPFPEETYRRTISTFSTWNFAPTKRAAQNLIREAAPGDVIITGNTVVDALHAILSWNLPICAYLPPKKKLYRVIATIHRRENFPHVPVLFKALAEVAEDPAIEVYMPLHPNPKITSGATTWLSHTKVQLIPPMDYPDWIRFMQTADILVSDSGGIQEEAPILGIPLLILRTETERPEVLWGNHALLVGYNPRVIIETIHKTLRGKRAFKRGSPFGDGKAAQRIVDHLMKDLRVKLRNESR